MDTTRIDNAVQVVSLKGQAFIIAKDGTVTPVKEGQILPSGTLLLTDQNSGIVFGNAPENTLAAQPVSGEAAAEEAEAIQAAILAGLDPTKLFAAPAAGNPVAGPANTDGSGNAGFVVVSRTGESVLAEAGFDTRFASQELSSLYEALPEREDNSIPVIDIIIDPPPTPPSDTPQFPDDTAFAQESALPTGSNPASDNESASGRFEIDTGNDDLVKLEVRLPGGEWVDITGGGVFIGQFGTLTVTENNGVYQWRYDLDGASDHPLPGLTEGDDILQDRFELRVTDDDGDQATAAFNVNVLDDGPVAENDSYIADETGLPSYNLVLVIDTSGSMGWIIGGDGIPGETGVDGSPNRLEIAQEALINLLNSYQGIADELNISIIDFGSGVKNSAINLSLEDAIIHIESLTAEGTTNYTDPLNEAQQLLEEQLATLDGYENVVYFLSDGYPNAGTAPASWQTFVDDNGIEVIAVGISIPESAVAELNKVENSGEQALIIMDPYELDDALQDTVPSPTLLSGNVLDNDIAGADGMKGVVSVTYNGVTYELDEPVNGPTSVDIPTGSGGTLTIYSDGNFTYSGPGNVDGDLTETFLYTMSDKDNDTASALLKITIGDTDTEIKLLGLDVAGGELTLDEQHLPDGSNPQSGELTKTGSFSYQSDVAAKELTIAGVKVLDNGVYLGDASGNVVIVDDAGRLLMITGYDEASQSFSYSYTLKDNSLLHDEAGRDSLTEQFQVFISDIQGATDTAVLDINIVDDIPDINGVQHGIMGNFAGTLSGLVDISYGADGPGELSLSGDAPDGLVYTTTDGPGGSKVLTATLDDAYGDVYFILTLYPDGHYDFELVNPDPVLATTKDLTGLTPGGPEPVVVLPINGIEATFTELHSSPDDGGINSSKVGMGIDNNHINAGDVMKVAFNSLLSNISFTLKNLRAGDTLTWSVLSAGVVVAAGTWTPPDGTGQSDAVVFNILDPMDGSTITYTTGSAADIQSSGFDELQLGAGDGDQYRLLDMTVYEEIFPEDSNLSFDIGVKDGDHDLASTSLNITIEADGTEASGFTLSGTAADEVLLGSDGDDVLDGGLGDNILTGGEGIDTFLFTLVDAGSVNTITDFEKGVDVVDLKALLTGEESGNLSDYLAFSQDGNDTVLSVTPAGDGGDSQQIRFEDTNLMDLYGVASSADLVQAMVDDQTLQVDR
ncbi:retention module-containing protein [Oceanimonas marisflavi]|uniref:retention module-containing protein n=1 Tax=Oceanimonas marisflavi TaxID=2059724 RepID=UPI000D308B47|nr:retention module-containing protein [Oceanimonas marisflavi]